MGIDVYLHWKAQTKEERFSVLHGYVGYLREAYHGGPYATEVLVPEGWSETDTDENGEVVIPNALLQQRLPEALETCKDRARAVYKEILPDDSPVLESYRNFVALHAKLEAEGREPTILVSY